MALPFHAIALLFVAGIAGTFANAVLERVVIDAGLAISGYYFRKIYF